MSQARKALGIWGESQAASYLEGLGYLIVGRNIRTGYGELDLVAKDGQITVFVEVKTRTSNRYGWPEEAVTSRKQGHLRSAAEAFMLANPELDGDWRIDVIAIERQSGDKPPMITHFIDGVF